MKSKKIIINVWWCIAIVLANQDKVFAYSPFPNATESIYFSLSVDTYDVRKENWSGQAGPDEEIVLTISMSSNTATAMTDCPLRKTTFTTLKDFLTYIQQAGKRDMNLSLMVKDFGVQTILTFENAKLDYNEATNTVVFYSRIVSSDAHKKWRAHSQLKRLTGRATTMFAEG